MITHNGPTAHMLIDQFLDHLRKLVAAGHYRSATLAYYERQLQKVAPLLPAGLLAADVKPFHLLPGPHQYHFHQAARRVFAWAKKVGLLDRDPLDGHKVPQLGRRERVPTVEERKAIYEHATPYFRRFLILLWATGARPGELRELTWENVSLEQGMAEVRDYKAKRRMKDAAPVRVLYLAEETVAEMRRWQEERLCTPKTHVLYNRYGEPWSRNAVCIAFRESCRRAGIDQTGERLVPYSFRHGRATELTEKGLTTRILMELLGHKQERTTHRYQHPRRSEVLQRFNEVLRIAT